MDLPDIGIGLGANPSQLSAERLRMAVHHYGRPSKTVCQDADTFASSIFLNSPLLSCFLQQRRDIRHQHLYRRVLAVHLPVRLCDLSSFCHQHTEIGTHAAIDEADVGTDDGDFLER